MNRADKSRKHKLRIEKPDISKQDHARENYENKLLSMHMNEQYFAMRVASTLLKCLWNPKMAQYSGEGSLRWLGEGVGAWNITGHPPERWSFSI